MSENDQQENTLQLSPQSHVYFCGTLPKRRQKHEVYFHHHSDHFMALGLWNISTACLSIETINMLAFQLGIV
jgi:hypothetical protein